MEEKIINKLAVLINNDLFEKGFITYKMFYLTQDKLLKNNFKD